MFGDDVSIPSESRGTRKPRSIQIGKANSTLNFNAEIYALLYTKCCFLLNSCSLVFSLSLFSKPCRQDFFYIYVLIQLIQNF